MNSYIVADLKEFINEYRKYKTLDNESNLELIKLYKKTKDIKYKNDIILGNLRLIVNVILRNHKRDLSTYNINIKDIISIGIIGLSNGIEKFDISRSSCISSVIRNYIMRDVEQGILQYKNIINCKVHLNNKKFILNKISRKYIEKNKKQPSLESLSKLTGIDINNIKTYYDLHHTNNFISIDTDKEDENGELLNIMADRILDDKQTVKYNTIENTIILNKISNYLTDKQKTILQKFIDLNNGLYKNQGEIAKELGVTSQNISAIFTLIVKRVKNLVANKEIENIFQL
jgi:RNA polymerase sigma factor (sigma-70 family)